VEAATAAASHRHPQSHPHTLLQAVRMGFIRKVYGLLSLQLLITFGIVCIFSFVKPVKTAIQTHPGALVAAIVLSFAFLIALTCCPGVAQTYPTNYLCLFGFTLAEGYMVGAIASYYDSQTVLLAVGITVILTLALTLFALQSRVDFTAKSGSMLVLLVCLLLFGLWTAFFPSRVAQTAYAALGAVVFGLFIIYDTQLIVGGKHRKFQYSVDSYVFAALSLYLDIVQLFLFILSLLNKR
jgi:FtsH-binding integral membrane protein